MIMADFSGDEAEELRRALSFHRSQERMEKVSVKLRAGDDAEQRGTGSDREDYSVDRVIRALRISRSRTRSVLPFSPMAARI